MSEIYEVEIKKAEDRMCEVYAEAYERRWRTKPVLSNNGSDQTILRDMIRQLGAPKVAELIRHYLEMDNEWFVKRYHPLETFKKEINAINADFGLLKSKQTIPKGLCLSVRFHCDKCMAEFLCVVPLAYNWERRTLCPSCSKGNYAAQ